MKTVFCMSTAKVLGLSLSLACPEVFNSAFSEHFSLPTHLESSLFPLSQTICSFSRAVVNKYLGTVLINYMYPPSWNGHPSQLTRKNYAGNTSSQLFQKKRRLRFWMMLLCSITLLTFQGHHLLSMAVKSPWHISGIMQRHLHLLASSRILSLLNSVGALFCYSAWRGLLLTRSVAENFLSRRSSGVRDSGQRTAIINVVRWECNLPNDPGWGPESAWVLAEYWELSNSSDFVLFALHRCKVAAFLLRKWSQRMTICL